jgi:hypothetical protein
VAAALIVEAPDFAGGIVASAFSARSNTDAAVSPRGGAGGEAASGLFATSLDCRDDFVGVLAGAMDRTGPSTLLLPIEPEVAAAFDELTGACTVAGVAAGRTSDLSDGHN